ncbi:MAG: diaminopimelate epimerase [Phycisphaerae bacterium]|nr:diaminopimelate epimerase [Phycisphaerae bacterium]
MQFTKMHGIGNDYIYVNGFEQDVPDPSALAQAVSDRHFGVGGDGLVLILPSQQGDVRMRMFNADGSEGMMCGNAIRCVAKFAHERNLATGNPVRVETASGIKTIDKVITPEGRVTAAAVDMGEPILTPREIPVGMDGENIIDAPFDALGLPDGDWMQAAGLKSGMTCVSMGNPHVMLFCKDVAAVPLEQIGPIVEHAAIFPDRINLNVVSVQSPSEVTMRTWERGSGITLACGTGASAVCVAGVLTHRAGRSQLVHLVGGDLQIEWREDDNHVFMTGPAAEVFTGQWLATQT